MSLLPYKQNSQVLAMRMWIYLEAIIQPSILRNRTLNLISLNSHVPVATILDSIDKGTFPFSQEVL